MYGKKIFVSMLFFVLYSVGLSFNISMRSINNKNTHILRNDASYFNKNRVISNETNDISKIYSTYNHKYSLIFYKNGVIEGSFNRTLKLKPNQDVLEISLVSPRYFRKLYEELVQLRTGNMHNFTIS